MKTGKKIQSEMLAMAVDEWKRRGGKVTKLGSAPAYGYLDLSIGVGKALGHGTYRQKNHAHHKRDWYKND